MAYLVLGLLVVLMFAVLLYAFAKKRASVGHGSPVTRSGAPTGDLREVIQAAGLNRAADSLLGMVRPCLRLYTVNGGEVPVGATKIGGEPDMPEDAVWPEWKGKPLSFIAQLSLADFQSSSIDGELPSDGLLSFFYDGGQTTWGFDPKDEGSWRVLYFDTDTSLLRRRAAPEGLPEITRYTQAGVRHEECESLPGYETKWFGSLAETYRFTEAETDGYIEEVLDMLKGSENEPGHQIMGYADEIQGAMELECQLVSNGQYLGDATGYEGQKAKELEAGAGDWRLLLQVGSDDNTDMMWGDAGKLYFWIRKQDLEARQFDKVWMILQCY